MARRLTLSSEACLLLRPGSASVFGETQAALVAVRTAARQRPADVVRPLPLTQAIMIEPDPDDDSLGRDNLRRGWPAQVTNAEGEVRDYV